MVQHGAIPLIIAGATEHVHILGLIALRLMKAMSRMPPFRTGTTDAMIFAPDNFDRLVSLTT